MPGEPGRQSRRRETRLAHSIRQHRSGKPGFLWRRRRGRSLSAGANWTAAEISSFYLCRMGLDEAAGDDQLLYFRSTFINSQWPDLAIEAFYNVIAYHSECAKNLNGGIYGLLRYLSGCHLGHGGFHGYGLP